MTRTNQNSHFRRAALSATALLIAVVAGFLVLPMPGQGKTAAELQNEIQAKRQREQSLGSNINEISGRIQGLRGKIRKLQRRQNSIQGDLDQKVARQRSIAKDLRISRARLARLKLKLEHAKRVLSARLIAVYKADQPDFLTVVLNSDGFGDLVERTTYLRHVADQDKVVIDTVTELKGETQTQTKKLASLEAEASRLVAQVRAQRDAVANAKGQLASRQGELDGVLGQRRGMLARVSKDRRHLEEDLAAMQQSSQQVTNLLGNIPAGPIRKGSGQLIWPVNGTFTSPFGMRWGRLHAGIDLAAGSGTPIRAADSGTVRYAGWMSGYGNYTCIQHSSSMSTCYAHQSSIGVSNGQSVKQGQVIGAVGNTGHSFGAHLHFEVRIGGSPVNPMGYL